ncbi:MAG: hypothetical protein LBF50_07035 [Azoarcus sp.]|jgi:hypothetical protein|nr:hypothetical protein [Azoarcus sp.]
MFRIQTIKHGECFRDVRRRGGGFEAGFGGSGGYMIFECESLGQSAGYNLLVECTDVENVTSHERYG